MKNSPQLLLPINSRCPKPSPESVEWMERLLLDFGDWITAADICRRAGIAPTPTAKRMLRAIADAAEPEIISGQKGYKHINYATAEEIHRSTEWFYSQAQKMITRANAIRSRAHKLIHNPE